MDMSIAVSPGNRICYDGQPLTSSCITAPGPLLLPSRMSCGIGTDPEEIKRMAFVGAN